MKRIGSLTQARWIMLACLLGQAWRTGQTQESETTLPRQERIEAANDRPSDEFRVPAWAVDARWYHVVVPQFTAAETSLTRARREAPRRGEEGDSAEPNEPSSSGSAPPDSALGALHDSLPYFLDLRVNTLYLTNLFRRSGGRVDLQHVADSSAAGEPPTAVDGSSDEANVERGPFSPADRAFLELVRAAHGKGVRVVVEAPLRRWEQAGTPAEREARFLSVTRRWMDPDGDGKPSDGIDGWVVRGPKHLPRDFWKRWRGMVKKLNPEALLVAEADREPATWVGPGAFDTILDDTFAEISVRFFGPDGSGQTPATLAADLARLARRLDGDSQRAGPVPISRPDRRLLGAVSRRRQAPDDEEGKIVRDVEGGQARWRLACMLQCFFAGAPMVLYGDEAGMGEATGPGAPASMRWDHLAQEQTGAADRGRFAALIQWLNIRREMHPALRRGEFRAFAVEGSPGVLAVQRRLPGEAVILLANTSPRKQRVKLEVGRDAEMATVLTPHLRIDVELPPAARPKDTAPGRITPLRMGASRQFVGADGTIRLWVDALSARIVLIGGRNRR